MGGREDGWRASGVWMCSLHRFVSKFFFFR